MLGHSERAAGSRSLTAGRRAGADFGLGRRQVVADAEPVGLSVDVGRRERVLGREDHEPSG